jgi:hypothetical protein
VSRLAWDAPTPPVTFRHRKMLSEFERQKELLRTPMRDKSGTLDGKMNPFESGTSHEVVGIEVAIPGGDPSLSTSALSVASSSSRSGN